MNRKYAVYGLGNAIMDLQLQVQEEDISRFALTKGGMKLVEPQEQSELIRYFSSRKMNQTSGGSAANTIIAITQLGAKTAYGCVVGDDQFGKDYFKEMSDLGIHLHTQPIAAKATGTCVILITPDAERTMNTYLGASVDLDERHVSEALIMDSEWLYLEGYLFCQESGQRVVSKAIELAKKHGTKVAITFSDAFIVDVFGSHLREAVKSADLVFANLTEASKFVGLEDVDSVFEKFATEFPAAVMTMSERGARVSFNGRTYEIPPCPARAIDDTGAGDSFAGAFIYALSVGKSPEQAGRLACFIASKVVSQLGPRLLGDVRALVNGDKVLSVQI